MAVINQIELKNSQEVVDIGAAASYVDVARNNSGKIVDNNIAGSTVESLVTTLQTHENTLSGKAPTIHQGSEYGVATTNKAGHVQVGNGLVVTNKGVLSIASTAQTLPMAHADSGDNYPYGYASTKNWGHVKIGNGLDVTDKGVVSIGDHSATDTIYGVATNKKYGHVKLATSIASGDAGVVTGDQTYAALTNGTVTKIGTASKGDITHPIYLNAGVPTTCGPFAPINHSNSTTTYGAATTDNYGHVKLAGSISSSDTNIPTAKQVYNALNNGSVKALVSTKSNLGNINRPIYLSSGKPTTCNEFAPKSHAITSRDYGGGTSTNYGHVKLSDNWDRNPDMTNGADNSVGASLNAVNILNFNKLKVETGVSPYGVPIYADFYFDYQNEKYGFNTDPSRGADTFHPFNNGVPTFVTLRGEASTAYNVNVEADYMAIIIDSLRATEVKINNVTQTYDISWTDSNSHVIGGIIVKKIEKGDNIKVTSDGSHKFSVYAIALT